MLRPLLLLLTLCCLNAEDQFMAQMPELIREAREIMAREPTVIGKLDGIVSRLEAIRPAADQPSLQHYFAAMGELQLLNGSYAEAVTAFMSTTDAVPDYNWGVWRKIIEAIYRGQGEAAARAEYDRVVALLGDRPMARDFADLVGHHLAELIQRASPAETAQEPQEPTP